MHPNEPYTTRNGHPMKCSLAGTVALCFLSACATTPRQAARLAALEAEARRAIAAEQSIALADPRDGTVGVAPLAASGDSTTIWLSYGLADLLMTDLARSSRLEVVDRMQLNVFLRELSLTESGRVDSARASRFGRLIGARHLVLGGVAPSIEEKLSLNARVADVSTTELRGALSIGTTVDDILDAEKQLALALFDQLGVTLTPAELAAVEARPTKNLAALLAYSRGVRHDVFGRYGLAADEYALAARLDPDFGLARNRLRDARALSATPAVSTAGLEQLQRAASAVAHGVNPAYMPTIGGPGDPSFSAGRTVTLIITVTNRP